MTTDRTAVWQGRHKPRLRLTHLTTAALIALLPSVAAADSLCGTTPLPSGNVQRVIDPHTIILTDGREIRLAAIALLLPPTPPTREAPPQWGAEARAALQQVAAGDELSLRADRSAPDRYGRLHAFVFVKSLERPLQHDMLARGLALVAPRVGASDCARELLALERKARAAGVGIWADPGVVRVADQPKPLLMERGRLALVEGRVLSVRESGGTIYVNFGRRWSEDFTVTIPKRSERGFVAAGLAPKTLERRRVLVRGVIEERGGPWIEARHAEQIELLAD